MFVPYLRSAKLGAVLAVCSVLFMPGAQAADSNKLSPVEFLDQRVAALKASFDARDGEPVVFPDQKAIDTEATRNAWLKKLYSLGVVEASELTKMTSDKLLMAKMIEVYAGEKSYRFHPKTIGLKYFLQKADLLAADKSIKATKEEIQAAIMKEFPMGYIVKPAAGINSQGKGSGFYFSNKKFLRDLLKEDSPLYQKEEYYKPYYTDLLKTVASGEKLILQENVILAAGYKKVLKAKEFVEVRVHTLANKVIPFGSYARWKETNDRTSQKTLDDASKFTQDFLNSLPKSFTNKMAWGIDVAALDNGALRILDINTNRGREKQWSGYMSRPGVLGAYTRYIEDRHNVRFAGVSGFFLRNNVANYPKYLYKKYVEGSQ